MVLSAFVGLRAAKMQCRHLDGDPTNNGLYNLAWGTSAENSSDTIRHGRSNTGERNGRSALTAHTVMHEILPALERGESQSSIGKRVGISQEAVCNINTGKKWSHLTGRRRG